MKYSGPGDIRLVLLAAIALWPSVNASAQLPGGSAGGVNAALTLLFGNATAFTSKVEAQILDATHRESLRMPMNFAALDSKVRVEIDVTQIQSRNLPAQQVKEMKDAGLGKIISIIRPDKKLSYILYPGTQSYSTVPMPREESDVLASKLKISKTVLGKETVDGHSCVKQRVTIVNGDRTVLEAVTWNATDLKDFPVQIETKDKGNTSILHFRQIQFTRPEAKLFEIPERYRQNG
jgi:Domain of unknown function (DUF4412)